MNERVANSTYLREHFDVEVVPAQLAEDIRDVGKLKVSKVVRAARVALKVAERLRSRRPHLVYFTLPPYGASFYFAGVLIALMKINGCKRIFHLRGKGVSEAAVGIRSPIYRWAFEGARVVLISRRVYRDVSAFVAVSDVRVLPNGIDDGARTLIERRETDAPTILFLSNMMESKGPLILVRALEKLRAQGAMFRAVFAGAPESDMIMETFHNAVHRAGLGSCVSYVGPAGKEAKDRLLREANIFAFPTFYPQEVFPGVLLEAMSYSLPVVSTFEGAIADIVEEGRTGFLVPQRDVDQLVEALGKLVHDAQLRKSFGAAGRQRFVDLFQLARFEREMGEIWSEALEAAAKEPARYDARQEH